MRHHIPFLAISFATLALLGGVRTAPAQDKPPPAATRAASDRPSPDQPGVKSGVPPALANPRATKDTAIDRKTVGTLGMAWRVQTDSPVSHSALPDGDDLYFADWGGSVYKVDARSGEVRWKKQIHQPKSEWMWHGFAGTGTLTDRFYIVAAVEGTAYAIDKQSGAIAWQTRLTDDPDAGSLATLLHHDGVIYLGLQSVEEHLSEEAMKKGQAFEANFRGAVLALEAASGKKLWQFDTAKPPQTGASVWSGFALDPQLGLLYFTTGNNYSGPAGEFSDAIVAVAARTGQLQWARQTFEHDVWLPQNPLGPDYDFGSAPQLMDVRINGQRRPLVIAGQKSGLLWAFDRATGERVWAASVGYGGVEGGMMGEASLGDGAIFAWSNNGYTHKKVPAESPLTVKKLDAATGRPLWVMDKAQPAALFGGGLLANDIYFVGSIDGTLVAYDADTGAALWRTDDLASISNSPVAAGEFLYVPSAAPAIFTEAWMKPDQATDGLFAYRVGQH